MTKKKIGQFNREDCHMLFHWMNHCNGKTVLILLLLKWQKKKILFLMTPASFLSILVFCGIFLCFCFFWQSSLKKHNTRRHRFQTTITPHGWKYYPGLTVKIEENTKKKMRKTWYATNSMAGLQRHAHTKSTHRLINKEATQ